MNPHQAKTAFETRLTQQGLSLNALTIDQACKSMLDFYRSQRADGCDESPAYKMAITLTVLSVELDFFNAE